MRTIQNRLADALAAAGEHIVPSRSRKYLVYTREKGLAGTPCGGFWYLGKSGALRYCDSASGSFAASDRLKEKILAASCK